MQPNVLTQPDLSHASEEKESKWREGMNAQGGSIEGEDEPVISLPGRKSTPWARVQEVKTIPSLPDAPPGQPNTGKGSMQLPREGYFLRWHFGPSQGTIYHEHMRKGGSTASYAGYVVGLTRTNGMSRPKSFDGAIDLDALPNSTEHHILHVSSWYSVLVPSLGSQLLKFLSTSVELCWQDCSRTAEMETRRADSFSAPFSTGTFPS